MAFQPDNLLDDSTINYVDPFVCPHDDFHGAIADLSFSGGIGNLNTPTQTISSPLATLSSGIGFHENNEPSTTDLEELFGMSFDQDSMIPLENMNEDFEYPILDVQSSNNGTGNDSDQPTNTEEQEAIGVIANELRTTIDEYSDSVDLRAIITAMNHHGNPIMRMRTQPVARHRFRYRSDGIRYLEQSRRHPMAVRLPILDGCLTKPDQSFWIQMTIITTRNNPHWRTFLHQLEMFYNGDNAQPNGFRSFRIPLTIDDIRRRIKKFRHLSVIKTKLDDYTFELTPFDPLLVDDHIQYYTLANEDRMTKVRKSKQFDREYHTNEYQIVCQLMIKQKDQWHMTDLYCETHIVSDN